jgi:hypothetical protein
VTGAGAGRGRAALGRGAAVGICKGSSRSPSLLGSMLTGATAGPATGLPFASGTPRIPARSAIMIFNAQNPERCDAALLSRDVPRSACCSLLAVDGGKSWKRERSTDDLAANLYDIKFITPSNGFILGNDGGESCC